MKLFNKIALTAVGAFMAVGAGVSALNVKAKSASAATMSVVSMSCDFTTKSAKASTYVEEWAYGSFKVMGGANNNAGWDYVKMGAKSENLSAANNPAYIASPKCEDVISKIDVVAPAGSLPKGGMAATVKVAVYSDDKYTTLIEETATQDYVKTAATYTFTPSVAGKWAKDSYYKV